VVIGSGSLLDINALNRIKLATYDSNGALIETASGSSLRQVNLLLDDRQTLSFNTTKDFAKVGIQISGLVSVVSNTDVDYAFTDNSNGSLVITTPAGPLPVVLTSFGGWRLASTGTAEISWATANEQNSAHFIVERAANPSEEFAAIGQVVGVAAGTSAGRHTYYLRDEAATQAGSLYYRLRQVPTAALPCRPWPCWRRAPRRLVSPFTLTSTQVVTLGTGSPLAAGYTISLYSGAGQLVNSRLVEGSANATTIGTVGLALGLYHVVLRDAAGHSVSGQRLVVAGH